MRTYQSLTQALRPFYMIAAPYRKQVARWVITWGDRSGTRWMGQRFKDLLTYLLQLRAGAKPARLPWWKLSHLKYPERVALTGSDEKFIQLLGVIRVFTLDNPGKLSPLDIEKFLKAIGEENQFGKATFPAPALSAAPPQVDILQVISDVLGDAFPLPHLEEQGIGFLSNDAYLRRLRHFARTAYQKRPSIMPPNLYALRRPELDEYLVHREMIPHALRWMEWSDTPYPFRAAPRLNIETQIRSTGGVGDIHYRIQTDGKVRWFYAPPYWMQYLLEPFGSYLYRRLAEKDRDCTYQQVKGVLLAQSWLRNGKTCHSVDLSSATDRFPLSVSISCLRHMYGGTPNWEMWLRTFILCSRLPVNFSNPLTGETDLVTWKVGQPLGTLPSFAVFALSHHFVMESMCAALKIRNKPYVILGDDIVIANDDLAFAYKQLMRRLEVSISLEKTLTSDSLAEFGGRVIGRDAFGFKLKHFPVTARNMLSALAIYGPKAIRATNSKLARIVALIPTPESPGYNPLGWPASKVDAFLKAYYSLEEEPELVLESGTVDERTYTARLAAVDASRRFTTDTSLVPPKGGRIFSRYGVPVSSPPYIGKRSSWKATIWLSRRFITRVRKAVAISELRQ